MVREMALPLLSRRDILRSQVPGNVKSLSLVQPSTEGKLLRSPASEWRRYYDYVQKGMETLTV